MRHICPEVPLRLNSTAKTSLIVFAAHIHYVFKSEPKCIEKTQTVLSEGHNTIQDIAYLFFELARQYRVTGQALSLSDFGSKNLK